MLVTVEGVPALFHFPISALTDATKQPPVAYVQLAGNPLDLAVAGDNIIVSLDNVHAPGSIHVVDDRPVSGGFQCLGLMQG